MCVMTSIPQPGRIHPPVWSRAASENPDLVKNNLTANTGLSSKTVLAVAVVIALLFLVLWLLS